MFVRRGKMSGNHKPKGLIGLFERKSKKMKNTILMISIILTLACGAVFAQTTEFTYQGRLQTASVPASGNYDFEFLLFDAVSGGTQIGSTLTRSSVAVADGTFAVKLDFGGQFPGANRFLEIHIRQTGGGAFTPLTPRQAVTSAPYSVKSLTADNATNATTATTATTSTNALQLGGVAANQFVQTNDGRLSDSRAPTGGSTNYIQNTTNQQTSSNFNINGIGTANILNAATQYNIGGTRVLSVGGNNNTFVGINVGVSNTTGEYNSFFGWSAGQLNTEGFSNSFFGRFAGATTTTGNGNSFFGASSGPLNTTGSSNSFFGTNAGRYNTMGNANSFFGDAAGLSNTTASLNSFFGSNTGLQNTEGTHNSFFGASSGASNTTASGNSYFGWSAGQLTTGGVNSFFGSNTGQQNTTGSSNSFFGESAGSLNTTGNFNSFFGDSAGFSNTIGANNTLIGNSANVGSGNLGNATAIGAGALVSQSNSLVLGNNANVGIGISAPNFKLQIVDSLNAGLRVQTNSAAGTVASFGGNGAFQIDAPGIGGGRFTVKENGNVGIGTNNPNTKLQVTGGSVYIANPNSLIITSPNGACWFITVNNAGALSTISVTCP